ncbi:MAG: hypothetical protein PHP22_12050 [Oscillospiraceae bacterium]|nr:hypothetical protein [Oscillospiraceae bacterium]
MKKYVLAITTALLVLSLAATAFAYPDASNTTSLPYSSSFSIKKSVTTKYCFKPASSSLSVKLTSISMQNSKSATLKVTPCYYISSSGKWAAVKTKSISIKSGSANDTTLSYTVKSGRKHCVKFSKSDYTSLKVSASFKIS